MTFDICVVTCNASKWIPACVRALAGVRYDCKNLRLFFADDGSADDTLRVLEQERQRYAGRFSAFEILPQEKNGGYACRADAAARMGKADILLFLDSQTEVFPDAFLRLEDAIQNAPPETAAFELRRFPFEHPKYYDPVTLETSWVSGTCFALRRGAWERTGGFDENFPANGADTDLSWHLRALGYKLQYVPAAAVRQDAGETPGQERDEPLADRLYSDLLLRCKYGSQRQIKEGMRLARQAISSAGGEGQSAIWEARRHTLNGLRRRCRKFFRRVVKKSDFTPQFLGLDHAFIRAGADYSSTYSESTQSAETAKNAETSQTAKTTGTAKAAGTAETTETAEAAEAAPEITVVVRTYRRPESLRLTLRSLKNQTYRAFHVIVVEDGEEPISRHVAEEARAWLDVEYLAANSRWGRCRAGNEGVAQARTNYVCFLDDDDYFFAEHLEVMAHAIREHPEAGLWCAMAVEARCSPADSMEILSLKNIGKAFLRPVDFFGNNPVPIQAVVFRRELYLECGGLDPELDAFEDWDLWLRMVCQKPVFTVGKATSIYRVPADDAEHVARYRAHSVYRRQLYQKMAEYRLPLSAQDIYSLFWQPPENTQDGNLNYEGWRIRAIDLENSHTWRITGPLRRIFYASVRHMEKFFGPAPIRIDLAPADDLYAYCIRIEHSFCWRFVSGVRRLLHPGKPQN